MACPGPALLAWASSESLVAQGRALQGSALLEVAKSHRAACPGLAVFREAGPLLAHCAVPLPLQLCRGFIKSKAVEPKVQSENFRVVFVGSTTGKDNNISIVLLSVDFSDAGKYTCHVKNPREKGNAEHSSYIELQVVHKRECPRESPAAWDARAHQACGQWP